MFYFYPLKTLENREFFGIFRGYKLEVLARNGLMKNLIIIKYSHLREKKMESFQV